MGITGRSPARQESSPAAAEPRARRGPSASKRGIQHHDDRCWEEGQACRQGFRDARAFCLSALLSSAPPGPLLFMVVVKATGFLIHIWPGRQLKKSPPNRDTSF